jgi:sugar phosphate isomerase/epimerase
MPRATYGMPALIEYSSLEDNLDLRRRLGLKFIELNMNMPYSFPENLPPSKLRRAAKEEDIFFTMHLPDEADLGSLHDSLWQGQMQRARETVEWAAQAEVRLLNVHINSGCYFTLPDRRVWIYDQFNDEFVTRQRMAMTELAEMAKGQGILLCVENMSNFHLSFVRRAVEEVCNIDGVGITWDIGHDARSGNMEGVVIRHHLERLRHMHMHDYDGRSDHQVPYTGGVDIDGAILTAEGRGLTVVIETKTAASLQRSVEVLREHGVASL